MKKIFLNLAFIFLILLTSLAYSKTVKFIQVTDAHISQRNAKYLLQFTKDIKDYKDIDFVVFTGDNIDRAEIDDLRLFLTIAKKIKKRTYLLIGNHDVVKSGGLDKKYYMKLVRHFMGFYHSSKPHYVFQKNGIVFIVLDGTKEHFPGPNGYFKAQELIWLDKMLTKYEDKKVVILQHYPLIDTKSKSHNTYKKEEYFEVLKKHKNVMAIISGHFHKNFEVKQDGIWHISTYNFRANEYYKIIEIDTDNNEVYTSLIQNSKAE